MSAHLCPLLSDEQERGVGVQIPQTDYWSRTKLTDFKEANWSLVSHHGAWEGVGVTETRAPWDTMCMHAQLLQLGLTLCNTMDCSPPGSSVRGVFQARMGCHDPLTGVGCHDLLQGVFPTQGSNLHLLCLLYWQMGFFFFFFFFFFTTSVTWETQIRSW